MTDTLAHIAARLAANAVAIEASAGVLFVAFVSCMPETPPVSLTEYWQWVRESLQTAIPAARRRQPEPQHSPVIPNPTPAPPGAPQTK